MIDKARENQLKFYKGELDQLYKLLTISRTLLHDFRDDIFANQEPDIIKPVYRVSPAEWRLYGDDQEVSVEAINAKAYVLFFAKYDNGHLIKSYHPFDEHDLETARIKLFPSKREGYMRWVTLVYVPDPRERSAYAERIRGVPTPAFEPAFARALANLELKQLK